MSADYDVRMRSGAPRHPLVLLLLSAHPGPSFAVTLVCILLGATSGLAPWRIAVLGVAVLLGQFSVGLSNDWLDAERDRRSGRADKPVARGSISEPAARNWAIAAGAAGLALTPLVGWPATAAHALFIAAGWTYNLWFKHTVLSVLPYAIGFGALPAVVTLAGSSPAWPEWRILAAGALLGISAHFANALPDLEADRATGVSGLPHRLGATVSGVLTFSSLAAAALIVVLGPDNGSARSSTGVAGWLALAAEGVIVAAGIILLATRPPSRTVFRLIILGALVAVAAIASTGSHLIAR